MLDIPNPLDDALKEEEEQNPQDAKSNRRHEAWLPKTATSQILAQVSSSSNSFLPDRASLTTPGVKLREELTDPVRNLLAHYRGESEAEKRQVLTANSVSQDQRGLRQLVKAGCYRAAVNLTSRLLQTYNQGIGQTGNLSRHTPNSLNLWFTRIALLVKLKQFSAAESELEAFGDLDRPDLYFGFYPDKYPAERIRNGGASMVPFSLRILWADLPQHLGKPHETLDRLYALLGVVEKILTNLENGKSENGSSESLELSDLNESLEIWRARRIRIYRSLVNCSVMQRDFVSAVPFYETLLELEKPDQHPILHSARGRLFLQLGDISSAEAEFESAKSKGSSEASAKVDSAFLAMANSDYAKAMDLFKEALTLQKGSAAAVSVNNVAVCSLYLGRLREGVEFLETQITANPELMLQETLILNLCTLYELESSYGGQKKRGILDLVGRYKGDGINASCLKLQM